MNECTEERIHWDQNKICNACKLYAVTDSRWFGKKNLATAVSEAINGGATFVQLREKDASTQELVELALELKQACRDAKVPLVINDDIEAAKLAEVDGVHVGQSDVACEQARKILGPDAIIGVSAQTVEQALRAQEAGADYLGVGAMFSTETKTDADDVSLDMLHEICDSVDIPVVAIGGIYVSRIPSLSDSGIDGVAVVSALFASPDIKEAAEKLRCAVDEYLTTEDMH